MDVSCKERAYDILTEREVQRPLFTEPKDKDCHSERNQVSAVNSVISNNRPIVSLPAISVGRQATFLPCRCPSLLGSVYTAKFLQT